MLDGTRGGGGCASPWAAHAPARAPPPAGANPVTLRGRLLTYSLVQVGALGSLCLVSGIFIHGRVMPMLDDYLHRRTERIAVSLATRLEAPLAVHDQELTAARLSYLADDPDLVTVEVRDRSGSLIAALGERAPSTRTGPPPIGLHETGDVLVASPVDRDERPPPRRGHRLVQQGAREVDPPLDDGSERVAVSPRDGELAQLGADLNTMAEALETRDAVLAARSRELEESVARKQQMLQQLKDTQQQLVHSEKFAVLGQTAATIAHEINNPASYIQVNLEELGHTAELVAKICRLLDDGAGAEDIQAWRDDTGFDASVAEMSAMVVESQGGLGRIFTIVPDLRSFARSGESLGEVQLVDVADRALRIMGTEIRHRARVAARREPVSLRADDGRLLQVMINLVSNALHSFGPRPAAENLLEVSVWREDARACLTLRDNGCGIPADIRDKIFEPFFTIKPIGEGTGLGLGICRSIVEQHGGSIGVESEPGAGSQFRIELPIAR
jgi:signal transduction histidine kinase